MNSYCFSCLLLQLLLVQQGSPAVVLLLRVRGEAVVTTEEGVGLGIPPQLHLPELLPAPVGVQVGGADEGEVYTHRPVYPTAVDADEDAVGNGGPGGVFGATVVARLVRSYCS